MTKNELLKLLILLARYVETYNESASDNDMNTLSDAYTVVQNKLLGCVDRTMKPVELFDIVDAQCKVVQEGADVKALEADNKRLRDEVERLTNAGLNCSYDAMSKGMELEDYLRVCEQKDERIARLSEYIERLEAKLYDIVGSKRDFDELLKMVKAER